MTYFCKSTLSAFALLFSLNCIASDSIEEFPLEPDPFDEATEEESARVFITPARMASSIIDSPNAVTALDVTTLRKLGITEMVDAMRLVPGMMVSETHGSDVSVGYHGANVNVPRRSEVLYNSNRLHRPGYAGAHWYRLPIDLQDLNFIEVVRGPSPEYGTNAMTSTVNLIQDTVATRGLYGSVRVGDSSTRDAFVNGGWLFGETQLGVRYFHRQNDGFDGAEDFEEDYKNNVSTDSIMINVEHRISNAWVFDLAGSYADSSYQVPGFGHLVPDDPFVDVALENFRVAPDTDETAGFISSKVHGVLFAGQTSHEITAGLNYSNFSRDQVISICGNNFAFDPRVSEVDQLPSVHFHVDDQIAVVTAMITGNLELEHSLVASPTPEEQTTIDALGPYLQSHGLSMLDVKCGLTEQDLHEDRYELNTHIVSHLGESLQNAFGVSLTRNDITSQTYLNGTVEQDSIHVYDTLRYSPSDRLVFNGTLSLETADNVDTSDAFSYRVAANYLIKRDWVLRFMHARSERLPDVYETNRHWTYYTEYDPGVTDHLGRTAGYLTRVAISPDDLEPEVLANTEVGLSYSVFDQLQADVKIFYEDYSDLISEAFNYVDFKLTNNGELKTQGIEFGLHNSTERGIEWGASYTYMDTDSDTPFELSLRPDHSGSLWAILPLGPNTSLSGVYFGATNVAEGSYDRFDFTLTHRIKMDRGHLDLQANYRRYPNGINAYTEISSITPNIALVDGQDRLFFTASLSFF